MKLRAETFFCSISTIKEIIHQENIYNVIFTRNTPLDPFLLNRNKMDKKTMIEFDTLFKSLK